MKPWKPGDPLLPGDEELLAPLVARAVELGRSPKVGEVENASQLKARFRIWKNALAAAGLPAMNDPAQVKLREKQRTEGEFHEH